MAGAYSSAVPAASRMARTTIRLRRDSGIEPSGGRSAPETILAARGAPARASLARWPAARRATEAVARAAMAQRKWHRARVEDEGKSEHSGPPQKAAPIGKNGGAVRFCRGR